MLRRYYVLLFSVSALIAGMGRDGDNSAHFSFVENEVVENRIVDIVENEVVDIERVIKGPTEKVLEGPTERVLDGPVEIVTEIDAKEKPEVVSEGYSTRTQPIAEKNIPNILPEEERRTLLRMGGWREDLIEAAYQVVKCESEWNSYVENGPYKGLFQLELGTWFRYANEDSSQWNDPLVNIRTGWKVYLYDEMRGNPPFFQWQCKPRG